MDIEISKCDVCGKENVQVERTYFEYPFPCQCCSPTHFIMVRHCNDCKPSIPNEIQVKFKSFDDKEHIATISNILPYSIKGEFKK